MKYWIIILFFLVGLTITGCAPALVEVRMDTKLGYLGVKRLPLTVALVIPEEVSYYVIQEKPSVGKGPPHIFQLGAALEKCSLDAFSQISEKLQLVRKSPDFNTFDLAIYPDISDFQFGYEGFEAWCTVNVDIRLCDDRRTFWEKNFESPVIKQATYCTGFANRDKYAATGEIASDAMKSVLTDVTFQIENLPEINEIVKKVKEALKEDSEFE